MNCHPQCHTHGGGRHQLAMEHTPFTLDGSTAWYWVTGGWRASQGWWLWAPGLPWRQKPRQIEEATAAGASGRTLSLLGEEIRKAEIVFNTIPAPVLTAGILEQAPSRLLIIDLASAPWGTDFDAAARRGIKAFPAPGLPGKVAPETAGKILATHLPGLIEEACVRPD